MSRTIAILTGGGDCPGLNAVIRGVVRSAILERNWRVIGIEDGFDGLVGEPRWLELTLESVRGILPRGGTILGTSNRGNPLAYPVVEDGQTRLVDVSAQVVGNFQKLGADALIAVGGDGTLKIARALQELGMPMVGVPKTIDNDLKVTDHCPGYGTAAKYVACALIGDDLDNPLLAREAQEAASRIAAFYEQREFSKAMREIMSLADHANAYIADKAPWSMAKEDGKEQEVLAICTTALNVFRLLVLYLKPVLPGLAERAEAFLDIPPLTWADAGTLLLDHPINKFKPLLSRVDMAHIEAMLVDSRDTNPAASAGEAAAQDTPEEEDDTITIDDFLKVKLRAARIAKAAPVEGADKLLQLTLDVGELGEDLTEEELEHMFTRADLDGLPDEIVVEPGHRVVHIQAGPHHLPKEALSEVTDEFRRGMLDWFARNDRPDVIHGNYWLSGVVGHRLKHELDVPFVSTFHTLARVKAAHGDPEPLWRDRAEAEIINCADAICVSCEEEADQFRLHFGDPQGRLEIIAPGVEHAFFAPGDQAGARRALGIDVGRPMLLFVGRIQPLKGPDVAIRALASLPDRRAQLVLVGGASGTEGDLETVDFVDIERFMGDWYVIANIPTLLEKGAHNAVETYEKNPDGTIATTFTFVDGSFDGKQKKYQPKGFIKDSSNAIWGMQFIWPVKADYRVIYLDEGYTQTVIGRNKRDYVWIMARTPTISDQDYDKLVAFVASIGYDTSKLERVPQRW